MGIYTPKYKKEFLESLKVLLGKNHNKVPIEKTSRNFYLSKGDVTYYIIGINDFKDALFIQKNETNGSKGWKIVLSSNEVDSFCENFIDDL